MWKFNHVGSHRSNIVKNRNNYKNPFAMHFTRFKVMKKRPYFIRFDVKLLQSLVLLSFPGLFFRIWVHGYRSGMRWNLVRPEKYHDDLLLGSCPYAPLSLNCCLSLEARSSPICDSWCMYLLLQPCLGNCSLPILWENPCLQSVDGPRETACDVCLAF